MAEKWRPKKGNWRWMGIQTITNEKALRKIRKTLGDTVEVGLKSGERHIESCAERTQATSRKGSDRKHSSCFSKPSRSYYRSKKCGMSYYDRFRVAPSARGIRFYGTKP